MGSAANETQELENENKDDDKIQETRVIIPETLELESEINDVNKKQAHPRWRRGKSPSLA